MRKYYWYVYRVGSSDKESNDVSSKHPFAIMGEYNITSFLPYTLLNWKQITYKEYALFKKVNS